jgi:hypothetical protein
MSAQLRTLRILRRPDGRFVTNGANPEENPLGVDTSLAQAIGTAVREATRLSRGDGCRVAIDVELANGYFRRDQIVNPPLLMRRNPRPAKPRNL